MLKTVVGVKRVVQGVIKDIFILVEDTLVNYNQNQYKEGTWLNRLPYHRDIERNKSSHDARDKLNFSGHFDDLIEDSASDRWHNSPINLKSVSRKGDPSNTTPIPILHDLIFVDKKRWLRTSFRHVYF